MTLRHDGSLHDEGSDVARNLAAGGDSECGARHPEGWGCTRTAGHDGRHEAGYPVRRGGVRLCACWEDQS